MLAMMQMQQTMGGLSGPGTAAQPTPADSMPALSAPGANPMFDPSAMQQMMQALQGVGGAGLPAHAAQTAPPEDLYASQVQQLESMGFPDKHSNLQALAQSHGDVNQAINALLGGA